jgi:hypothetical protein
MAANGVGSPRARTITPFEYETDCPSEEGKLPISTTPELGELSKRENVPASARQTRTSALQELPKDILHLVFDFLAGEPQALVRLAASCRDMKAALDPYVQHYTWRDRGSRAYSLEKFQRLLDYGVGGRDLPLSIAKQPRFRAELLTMLGRRILALPAADRSKACKAFIDAVEQYNGQKSSTLETTYSAAKQGVAHLEAVEKAAVDGSLPTCRRCNNLTEVMEVAATRGICSVEGLAEMKFAAACGKVAAGSTWGEARALFALPNDTNQAQREYDYDVMLNWRDRFYE